jgi:hypothetical protein
MLGIHPGQMLRRTAVLTFALCAALPAAALAAPATEAATPFNDRTIDHGTVDKATAHAAQATTTGTIEVPLTEGGSVKVSFTPSVGSQPELAQQYVGFLETLPHGPELAELRVTVATPDEVNSQCGGTGDDNGQVLGCYGDDEMIVPSTGLDNPTAVGDYTVRYVLTHEYGHHIAAHRSNNLGGGYRAIDWGPKFWSSYELVCDQTGDRKLFPGDELRNYLSNPGEAWAETYARLVYPEQPWTWTKLLMPDTGALDAARKDVLTPWTKNTSTTFTMASHRNAQAFDLPLTLDGALKVTATAPSRARLSVNLTSGAQKVPLKHKSGSRTWSLGVGCREKETETVTFHLQRQGGKSGPVALKISYAG